ncbi:MAG: hypothetical protein O2892_19255 [Actinomycetota bacterium]|nr:hypothetical protein [Actinomycetota bacterium]MDA2951142.1 hypothetical protein [Actinomycetota bacterium]
MSDYLDADDAYEVDALQGFALERAAALMAEWEIGRGKSAVNAAYAYATISLAASRRLEALGGIPEPEPSHCKDCDKDVTPPPPQGNWEYFMVHDHVWSSAGMTGGHLCLDCLESRLGRSLTGADLMPDPPINEPDEFDTPRMAALKQSAQAMKQNRS